jgi:hypothetical protein
MIDNIHHDLKDEHPVKRGLLSQVSAFRPYGNIKVQDAVLKHGYPFIGIKRPKEYRPRAIKKCFVIGKDRVHARVVVKNRVLFCRLNGVTHDGKSGRNS